MGEQVPAPKARVPPRTLSTRGDSVSSIMVDRDWSSQAVISKQVYARIYAVSAC